MLRSIVVFDIEYVHIYECKSNITLQIMSVNSICNVDFSLQMLVFVFMLSGLQKLREGAKGPRRKVWTQTKILSSNIRYFVAILRFVAIYALFGRLCQTVFFGVNKSVSWVRIALL